MCTLFLIINRWWYWLILINIINCTLAISYRAMNNINIIADVIEVFQYIFNTFVQLFQL